ncbi:MAG: 30S ribosomal protein S6--L-glutamate ligase [Methanobacteriota archaeon]|nr:MAG: 30S ribosomal protein S6--L-glutamate ligase [Euryarchaeota archaeon]
MRIGILSLSNRLYATRRLIEAVNSLGHQAVWLNTLACSMLIENGRSKLLHGTEVLEELDVVIPRVGRTLGEYGVAVVRQLEAMGVPVLNSSKAIATAHNKFGCLQLLAQHGIQVPNTLFSRSPAIVNSLLDHLGGLPVVLKMLEGSQGVGVVLANNRQVISSVLDLLWGLGKEVQVQEFVEESGGSDIRILVLGGRVVAAMKRTARPGDFRSNVHRGGSGRPYKLGEQEKRVAVNAAKVVGLELAGVDILPSRKGPLVVEVNASPGFEELERITQLDIAKKIVVHTVKSFQDIQK